MKTKQYDKNEQNLYESIHQESKKYNFLDSYFTSFLYQKIIVRLAFFYSKHSINPNYITLLMLLTTVLSAILFLIPSIYSIIVGTIVIQFFEIFDDVDGMVARATNKLSKKGEQLDFMMHLICHPILILVYGCLSYRLFVGTVPFQMDKLIFFILLFGLLIIVELMQRLIISFNVITNLKIKAPNSTTQPQQQNRERSFQCIYRIIKFLKRFFDIFPVYALIVPFMILFDFLLPLNLTFWYTVVFLIVLTLTVIKEIICKIIEYTKCSE